MRENRIPQWFVEIFITYDNLHDAMSCLRNNIHPWHILMGISDRDSGPFHPHLSYRIIMVGLSNGGVYR